MPLQQPGCDSETRHQGQRQSAQSRQTTSRHGLPLLHSVNVPASCPSGHLKGMAVFPTGCPCLTHQGPGRQDTWPSIILASITLKGLPCTDLQGNIPPCSHLEAAPSSPTPASQHHLTTTTKSICTWLLSELRATE